MIDIIERLQRAETRPLVGTDSWVELWKVLSDARIALTRLEAINESLRREVREQRREIAGLREERRALVAADRPQVDELWHCKGCGVLATQSGLSGGLCRYCQPQS